MSEKNKILNFLINGDFDICYFEANHNLRVHFKKENDFIVKMDEINFDLFIIEFDKVIKMPFEN